MGLSVSDVYTAIQLMLAPVYANDFVYQGRILRVLLQADAPYRMTPQDLSHYYVITNSPGTTPDGSSSNAAPGLELPHAHQSRYRDPPFQRRPERLGRRPSGSDPLQRLSGRRSHGQ